MVDLYILDNQLQLLGVCDVATSLLWIARYKSAGAFELYAPATDANIKLLQPYRFIYRPDVDETMYIATVREERDVDSGKNMIISGYAIEGIYRKRMVKSIVLGSLRQTMLIGRPFDFTINYTNVENAIDCGYDESVYNSVVTGFIEEVEDAINDGLESYMRRLLNINGYGVKLQIDFATKMADFVIYAGRDLSSIMVFAESFDNLSNSVYSYSEEECYNTIYGYCIYPSDTSIYVEAATPMPEYTAGADNLGIKRNEKKIAVEPVIKLRTVTVTNSDGSTYQTTQKYLDFAASEKLLIDTCENMVTNYTENFEGTVLARDYRSEFNVGDIVTVRDDVRGVSYVKRVEEVQERFEPSGYTVVPTFGEPLKTIYDLIKER